MNRNQGAYEWVIGIFTLLAFTLATGWSIIAAVLWVRDSGPVSFGSAISLVGVCFAFGVYYSVELLRRRTDRALDARFDEVLAELKKRECRCLADRCKGADVQESEGRSWLGALMRRWVGR